ncbi:Peptidase C14, caspase catalytic subunit p20 [Fulvivirga imtechensis AK7]|uniref:Peptidase C14, caspase catalytic subunit p20 n=1 Tax=Fulvivirga imtechensis AK7 TaxID=1237149 RepID=L8JVD2_9BACT|nr:ATP-binding protein [Fulvivirga imtechensis]ELR71202.1 Peptidase C14, caspase catalytic subunit p20 [Fulvivirga imtechensis AK7]
MAEHSNHGHDRIVNPFPGLRPYGKEECQYYYSYGYRTDDVLSRLRANKFLTLVGEPGSGKASLVNCAIIPTLMEGFAGKGGNEWNYITLRPGTNPLKNLAQALAHSKVFLKGGKIEPNFADQLEEALRENVQGLLQVFEKYRLEEEHNLLIVIDDFEDIFAYQELYVNPEDTLLFINLILKFIRRSNFPVYIVISLSSDFLSESSQYPGLPEMINDSQYMLPKMDGTLLRKVLAHAFTSSGIRADQELINTIVHDFSTFQANNYQLQYVLKSMVDLWLGEAQNADKVLGVKYYDKAGGLDKAIERTAESIYSKLTKKQKRICTYLFRCVTLSGENSRTRAVVVEDVSQIAKCNVEEVVEVINYFGYEQLELIEVIESYDIEERLDSLDELLNNPFSLVNRYSKITLRNIELVECWSRLKRWVEEENKSADIYLRLVNSALLHRQGKKGFFMNPELEAALDWYRRENPGEAWAARYEPNFTDAVEYLFASEQNHQHQLRQERLRQEQKVKRDKQFRWVLIIASIISLALAGWAYNERMHEKKLGVRLNYVQDLDSLRVIYIDALQDMDSAHIDQLRFKVRSLSQNRVSSMDEILQYAESMIERDSLCKKSLKAQIVRVEAALMFWSQNWNNMDEVNEDSAVAVHRTFFTNFCETLRFHCGDQWVNLTSINYKCDALQK